MLTPHQITELAADLESYHVERKESFKSVKGAVEEALCAFANDLPGSGRTDVILIGVSDKTGAPTGLQITDELLREITDIRSSGNILPFPLMHVYKAPIQWFWFSDRIEIHNPGGLFGRTNPENFGKTGGNDYRNPHIAAALHYMGFVQRFGMGIPMARKACSDNGNPPPESKFETSTFAVIVRART